MINEDCCGDCLAGKLTLEITENGDCELLNRELQIEKMRKAMAGLIALLVFPGDSDSDIVRRFGIRSFNVIKQARESMVGES